MRTIMKRVQGHTLGPAAFVALFLILAVLPYGLGRYGNYLLAMWLVQSLAVMGLNLTLGYAGQVNLGQAAFLGIGAYTTALMTMAGFPWVVAVVVGVIICFIVGLLLGYPALRVQHHHLAFVTLAFSMLAWLIFRNEEWLTNGVYGLIGIPRPDIFGMSLDGPVAFSHFALGVTAVATFVLWWLLRSPWGRAFTALRENRVRAESLGVNTRLYTLLAFGIGAVYGGIAGSLFAPLVQFVDPSPFTIMVSLNLLLAVVVGGSGYFAGPFVGAGMIVLLPEFLRFADEWYMISYAALVMVLLVFCPSGLLGFANRVLRVLIPTTRQKRDALQGLDENEQGVK